MHTHTHPAPTLHTSTQVLTIKNNFCVYNHYRINKWVVKWPGYFRVKSNKLLRYFFYKSPCMIKSGLLHYCHTETRDFPRAVSHLTSIYETGADFEGGTPGARPSIFGRDRASDFVWAPQAKRMHQIVRIDLQFFSASEGTHPPQTLPVPIGAKVLSVLNLGSSSFKKSWIRPCET